MRFAETRLELRGFEDVAAEYAVPEPWREALDLRLDALDVRAGRRSGTR